MKAVCCICCSRTDLGAVSETEERWTRAVIEGENLTTLYTRLPQAEQGANDLYATPPDALVLVAQAERWW